jgi:hypothetical protein
MRFMGILLLVVNFASTPSWPSQRVAGLADLLGSARRHSCAVPVGALARAMMRGQPALSRITAV